MKWILGAAALFLFLQLPMIGIWTSSNWAPWWFSSPQSAAKPVAPGVVPVAAMAAPQGPLASDSMPLMQAAQKWMGVPYLFGGASMRGVDCSNFVYLTGRDMGLNLPPPAENQWNITRRVTDPRPGDLVFFKGTYCLPGNCPTITHVGWYVGDGMMISAAEPAVGRQSLSSSYWRSHLAGYGRLAG
jgi:cell wall-associated NlpC family hydrolase